MAVTGSGTLHHTCFVVRDVERTAAALSESVGIGPWGIWTIEPESGTVHGREASFSFRIALATVGDAALELLAPLAGESIYEEHLAEKGEGFHHTCIAYASREAMQAAKADLARRGRELVQSGDLGPGGEFCYFAVPETGALLELLYTTELPEPEATIG
jgi:catechol 2,3-dioxygenase-like lactoylglutathione lyase family enzyme